MRVLTVGNMYPPHHLGGYELLWRSAVRAAREAGHDVTVLTTDHRGDAVTEPEEPGVHRVLRWYWDDHAVPRRSPLGRRRMERADAAAFDELAGGADVVWWWAMGGLPLELLRHAAALPSAAVVIDDWLVYGPLLDGPFRLWRRRIDASTVDRWAFCSRWTMQRAGEEGYAFAHAEVIPPGIDPGLLDDPVPRERWEGRLLCLGRLDERKGVHDAIAALGQLPGATLTIAGTGDRAYEQRLRKQAAPLGDRVRFAGPVARAELAATIDAHDAVVFPVLWEEPWGLVPLEAMARGRPVVATGRGGSGEYLVHGENCLVFPAGDARALAAAVSDLASDPGRFAEPGRATARRHLAPDAERRLVALLEETGQATR